MARVRSSRSFRSPLLGSHRRQGAGAGGDRGVPDRSRRGRPAPARARRPPSRRPQHAGAARAGRAWRRRRPADGARRLPRCRCGRDAAPGGDRRPAARLRRRARARRGALGRGGGDAPHGAADARRIHDRTDGNPFFVRELARHLAERRDGAGGVPDSVSDVVLARVARLSTNGAETLRRASVLGESFDLAVLERFDGPEGVLDALDEAAAAGLLEDGAGGRYRFAHALTRDAVYGGTGASRRSDLHRRAAAALEARARPRAGAGAGRDRRPPLRRRRPDRP